MMKNTIFTDVEYIRQGFTKEEVPMIRKHDMLYNKSVDGLATEEEMEELYKLAKDLRL